MWLAALQLVVVVSNIFWCAAVEGCFKEHEPPGALAVFLEQNVVALRELTALVRGQLSALLRKVGEQVVVALLELLHLGMGSCLRCCAKWVSKLWWPAQATLLHLSVGSCTGWLL